MKTLAIIFVLALAGCAATLARNANLARDANLAFDRMIEQFKIADLKNDYPAMRGALLTGRDEYYDILGKWVLINRLTTLALEVVDLNEEKDLAIKYGIDPALQLAKRERILQAIADLVPEIDAEIAQAQRDADQQAQRDADQRAHNASMLGSFLLGAVLGTVAQEAVESRARAPAYQTPTPTPSAPTNCVIVPAMRSTVTGQPYIGTYDQIRCR